MEPFAVAIEDDMIRTAPLRLTLIFNIIYSTVSRRLMSDKPRDRR